MSRNWRARNQLLMSKLEREQTMLDQEQEGRRELFKIFLTGADIVGEHISDKKRKKNLRAYASTIGLEWNKKLGGYVRNPSYEEIDYAGKEGDRWTEKGLKEHQDKQILISEADLGAIQINDKYGIMDKDQIDKHISGDIFKNQYQSVGGRKALRAKAEIDEGYKMTFGQYLMGKSTISGEVHEAKRKEQIDLTNERLEEAFTEKDLTEPEDIPMDQLYDNRDEDRFEAAVELQDQLEETNKDFMDFHESSVPMLEQYDAFSDEYVEELERGGDNLDIGNLMAVQQGAEPGPLVGQPGLTLEEDEQFAIDFDEDDTYTDPEYPTGVGPFAQRKRNKYTQDKGDKIRADKPWVRSAEEKGSIRDVNVGLDLLDKHKLSTTTEKMKEDRWKYKNESSTGANLVDLDQPLYKSLQKLQEMSDYRPKSPRPGFRLQPHMNMLDYEREE